MSKLFSISLSFILLLQSLGLHFNDIARLDKLIEHAQYHSEQFGDNVSVFISKHYGELKADHEKEHQEEKKDHEKLPFNHHCHISSASVFVLNTLRTEFKTFEFSKFSIPNFYYQEPSSSSHTKGLLQPPRLS
tara:strand:+ start:13504 stop:13902 length:399 start_codon:yes stop_codon:yes gene_type:complete